MTKPSILIVEDEAIVAEDLAGKIQRLGYDVAGTIDTGEEAVELARHQRQPALVLMDIRLAGAMDGITAAQQIIRECHLPVLFLTAHSDPDTVGLARQTGALGYILKPFDERHLHIQIEIALYKHAMESQLRLSLERHRILAETMLQGVVHADANSNIIAVNPAAKRILGQSREQVVGSCPATWEHHTIRENGEPFPSSEYPTMIAVRTGLPVKGVIMGIFNPELDSYRWISVDAVPVFSPGEKLPTEVFTVLEDVTDREYYKRGLEEMVAKRTAEFVAAKEEAERRSAQTVVNLIEIKKLKEQLEAEKAYLQDEIKLEHNYTRMIGQSDALKKVLHKVKQIANSDTTVLILGETGTGKELIARAIHDNSQRKNRPLVKVNCAALPANLIESELFGHEKGAFTGSIGKHLGRFEVANRGTLFLDEMGELPLELQGKLLRVLQEGEFERVGGSHTIKVDTRIIAATNRNLEEEVREGRFREDLWYRLNIFPIITPPLRDRPEDIPLLVDFFVKKIAKRMGKTIEIIPVSTINALLEYQWPGNIRELENVLERAVINYSGPKLRLADELKRQGNVPSRATKTLAVVERDYILQVLNQTEWKVSGKNSAAEILGLDRSTLRARMTKLNIEKE
jgi:DNA-binding NtrC family response regulator